MAGAVVDAAAASLLALFALLSWSAVSTKSATFDETASASSSWTGPRS